MILDYQNSQTIPAELDSAGNVTKQSIYEGIHEDVTGLTPIQTVVFLSGQQLILDSENQQTILATLDADGNVTRQDVYAGLHESVSGLDPMQSVIF